MPQLRAAQNPLWQIRCLICQNPLIFRSLPLVVGADVLHEVRVQGSEETWPCPDSSVHLLQLEQLMPGGGTTGLPSASLGLAPHLESIQFLFIPQPIE